MDERVMQKERAAVSGEGSWLEVLSVGLHPIGAHLLRRSHRSSGLLLELCLKKSVEGIVKKGGLFYCLIVVLGNQRKSV